MDTTLKVKTFMSLVFACVGCLWTTTSQDTIEASRLGVSHLGTFEGSTTFTTSSSNGINPGLFIEVVDDEGNLKQYSSEDGIITIPDTKEGAYVTQAKLLGKTKYRDQDTGELLDAWEEGRNLTLESVQMPGLTTTGENVFSREITDNGVLYYNSGVISYHDKNYWATDFIEIEPNKNYSFMMGDNPRYCLYDENKTYITGGTSRSFNTSEARYVKISGKSQKLMLVYGTEVPEIYKPFKSNILTVNEDVELQGIGEVQDTLDLMTGEIVSNFATYTFNGSEVFLDNKTSDSHVCFGFHVNNIPTLDTSKSIGLSKDIPYQNWSGQYPDKELIYVKWAMVYVSVSKDKLVSHDVNGLKMFLKEKYETGNPISFIYPLHEKPIKTVDLKGTHQFPLLNKSFVQLKGEATPVITSITVPSESLPFTLDPNQETGQQFIAPEFEVTNDSNAPLSLTLKTFEQMTDVLNDVLPTKYDSWEGLSKEESKDIALGLMAKSSTDWLTYTKEPHYVSETMNKLLGTIKPNGTVGFEFMAHHGQAFSEVLNPSYKLTFVFDLLN